jgi:hypothetical protein
MVLEYCRLQGRSTKYFRKDNGYSSICIISQQKHVWIFQEENSSALAAMAAVMKELGF